MTTVIMSMSIYLFIWTLPWLVIILVCFMNYPLFSVLIYISSCPSACLLEVVEFLQFVHVLPQERHCLGLCCELGYWEFPVALVVVSFTISWLVFVMHLIMSKSFTSCMMAGMTFCDLWASTWPCQVLFTFHFPGVFYILQVIWLSNLLLLCHLCHLSIGILIVYNTLDIYIHLPQYLSDPSTL